MLRRNIILVNGEEVEVFEDENLCCVFIPFYRLPLITRLSGLIDVLEVIFVRDSKTVFMVGRFKDVTETIFDVRGPYTCQRVVNFTKNLQPMCVEMEGEKDVVSGKDDGRG